MSGVFYRLTNTRDPEERLEDACLWKAMKDFWGAGIAILPEKSQPPEGSVCFGRTRYFQSHANFAGQDNVLYAADPAFLRSAGREFHLCDLEGAIERVADLHRRGKDAFVKATEQKLMTLRVPVGTGLMKGLGDDVWSFLDKSDCLMVQEYVPMRNERRFVVIDRKIVAQSPIAIHLTPPDRADLEADAGAPIAHLHFTHPGMRTPHVDASLSEKMTRLVEKTAADTIESNLIIDVCQMPDGEVAIVEFNPCRPGMFGLYACNPRDIAAATTAFIGPDLLEEACRRRRDDDVWPTPGDEEAQATADDAIAWLDGMENPEP